MQKLGKSEGKCLAVLAEYYHDEANYFPFASIAADTRLNLTQVKRAVRSLARKGLAQYARGLWNDEGPAGSGYGCTEQGQKTAKELRLL